MEDKFMRGMLAGVIGGIASNIGSFLLAANGFTTLRYADWAAIMIFSRTPPFTAAEIAFATLSQIFFSGALGVAFAFLLPFISSRYFVFKGWFFSVMVWFFIYAVSTLFKVEGTLNTPLKTALGNFVAATIYGLVLAYSYKALSKGSAASESRSFNAFVPEPAAKPIDRDPSLQNESGDDRLPPRI